MDGKFADFQYNKRNFFCIVVLFLFQETLFVPLRDFRCHLVTMGLLQAHFPLKLTVRQATALCQGSITVRMLLIDESPYKVHSASITTAL